MTGEFSVVLQDPVHGSIELSDICIKVINTPQFQRLRFIKQLGITSFVYPGAVHTRFEHSIGTCYLASSMVRMMMQRQPELGVDEDDLKCVSIAALCHDLGHGPFSHLFDRSFLPLYSSKWKHEIASIKMLEHLIQENKLDHFFSDLDLLFISELILPVDEPKARGPDKHFLYQIVSNRDTGIDVDKWDYFSRDSLYLGVKSSFDSQRLMKFVAVKTVNGVRKICYRDKVCENIADMFDNRIRLFKNAYFHKTTLIIDYMVTQVLRKANDHLKITGKNGKQYKLSECIEDMVAYNKLTDDLLMRIYHSEDDALKECRDIIDEVFKRRLPKFVGKMDARCINKDAAGLKGEILQMAGLHDDDVVVLTRTLDAGLSDKNPLNHCFFFSKNSLGPVFKIKSKITQQTEGRDIHHLVYSKRGHYQAVKQAYETICMLYKLPVSRSMEEGGIELTPNKEAPPTSPENDRGTKRVKRSLI